MSRRVFDALLNLFGNHPVYIILGMGALFAILELLEGRSFMKDLASNSLYSFSKSAFFVVMFVALIGAFAYQAIFVKIDTFKKLAKTLDLNYQLKNHPTADVLMRMPILRRGERREIVSPILSGRYREVPVVLFDIRYGRTETAGESYNFYFRTVVAFSVQGQSMPLFNLLPARPGNSFPEMIPGEGVVAFDEDPEFSRRYMLKGLESEPLKRIFSPELRRCFLQSKGQWAAAFAHGHLVFFKDTQTELAGEDEYASYLMNAFSLYQIIL